MFIIISINIWHKFTASVYSNETSRCSNVNIWSEMQGVQSRACVSVIYLDSDRKNIPSSNRLLTFGGRPTHHATKCHRHLAIFSTHPNLIIRLNCPLFRDEHRFFLPIFEPLKLNWHWTDLTAWRRENSKKQKKKKTRLCFDKTFYLQNGIGHSKFEVTNWRCEAFDSIWTFGL